MLIAAPHRRPPGGCHQHGQVDQHRQPGGDSLQDHGGPGLGERDDCTLLGKLLKNMLLIILDRNVVCCSILSL